MRVRLVLALVGLALLGACTPPIGGGGGGGPTSTQVLTAEGQQVTFAVEPPLTVSVVPSDGGSLPAIPDEVVPAAGAFVITVAGATPGSVVEVTITPENAVVEVRKLVGGLWDAFSDDGTTGATIAPDGRSITLRLRDGGRGDDDGVANGTVVDDLSWGVPRCWVMGAFDVRVRIEEKLTAYAYRVRQYVFAGCTGPSGSDAFIVQADTAQEASTRCNAASPSLGASPITSGSYKPSDAWACLPA